MLRWMRLVGAALLAASSVIAPARAEEDAWNQPQPAWEGVWAGTLGQTPIHVCLDHTPYEEKGAYYYDRIKRLLRLVPGPAAGKWFEQATYDKNGALWAVTADNDALTGTWSDGKSVLPIRLTRIGGPSKDFSGPCGDLAFHRPRLDQIRLVTKKAVLGGAAYTVTTFSAGKAFDNQVEISTFALGGSAPPIAKVNALLQEALPKADGTGEWLECMAANVNSSGMDGDYVRSIEPTLITPRWLAAGDSEETDCGGAHPNNSHTPRTFDLSSGTEVNPLDWFGPKAVHREIYEGETEPARTLTPAFIRFLLKGWKADSPDCDGVMDGADFWHVGIAKGALVFSPDLPRVVMACGEDIKMPFARLQPWLNPSGKAMVATLPR